VHPSVLGDRLAEKRRRLFPALRVLLLIHQPQPGLGRLPGLRLGVLWGGFGAGRSSWTRGASTPCFQTRRMARLSVIVVAGYPSTITRSARSPGAIRPRSAR